MGRFFIMKTKTQKQEELNKGKELLNASNFLVFTDFNKVGAEDIRNFRKELRAVGASFLVIKKRLLGILLKERGIELDAKKQFAFSLGTVFTPDIEKSAGVVFKFFKGLNVEKEKILGGYDLAQNNFMDANTVRTIGQLPPREVLLGQLLGMLAAPIQSFLYVLSEKSKMVENNK